MARIQPSRPDATDVSHADRVVFPDIGLTKGELVAYYDAIAPTVLPQLRGRPLMLQRFPAGIDGHGFYQKDVEDAPDWVRTVELPKEGGTVRHVVCNDADTLHWLANRNAVALHGWLSLADRPNHPDRLIFDLDPTVDDDFATVRRGARFLREQLEAIDLVPFVMTTGSRGVHVTVPLHRKATFDEVETFAAAVAERLVDHDPDRFTVAFRKADRGDRVYVDIARNRYAQTAVVPYTVRPKPTAPVATPIDWDELGRVTPQRWTVRTIGRRLARKPDPWAAINRAARALPRRAAPR